MRTFLRILLGLVLVVVLLAAGGLLLPRAVAVERSVEIAAPPRTVFVEIDSLQDTAAWSPWRADDLQVVYTGPERGVGNAMTWTSETLGAGRQEIVVMEENARVVTDVDFGDMGTAVAAWTLAPVGEGTLVRWTMEMDMGSNPAARWMGLMMDRWVGADYERGLEALKARVEGA